MATMMTTAPPHPSSTLVNISDDADARLIRVLAPSTSDPPKFENICAERIRDGDAAGLIRTMIDAGAIEGLLVEGNFGVDEAVAAFSLLTVYLDRVNDAALERELCAALADAVGKDGGANGGAASRRSEKQSSMLAALFNLRSDGNEKVRLMTKLVEIADASALSPGEPRGVSALADALDPSCLKASLGMWSGGDLNSIGGAELRALYKAVSKGMDRVLAKLEKGQGDETNSAMIRAAKERKQTFMLLLLDTYKDKIDDEALSIAREAAVYAIRDPIDLFSTQKRILSLPALSALQKSKKTSALYDLLKIFMEGKLQDYRDFTAMPDKSTVFAAFGLDEDACARNMCLLSLVSLASEHEEIPYSAVASTLSVGEDDVERWVIRAVSSGLMEAKMDQLRRVVLVERCAVRRFGPAEWTAMKRRLDKWKANVRGVMEALEKSGVTMADDQ